MKHTYNTSQIQGLAFLLVLLLPLCSFGQKLSDVRKNADTFFANNRYKEAMFEYSRYQQEKPGDKTVLTNLGICNFHLGDGAKALEYLEYVFSQDTRNPSREVFLYLAKSHHGLHNFQKAVVFYKAFLKSTSEKDDLRPYVVDNIKRCLSGMTCLENKDIALVENLGAKINSDYDEFAPIPSINRAGRIYFSAARPESAGGRRTEKGLQDDTKGVFCSDMYYADSDHSGWYYPERFGEFLNTARHEQILGFNESGKVLYYFRGFTSYSGDLLTDTSGTLDEYKLAQRPFSGPIRTDLGDAAPFFFKDSILIFASRRAGSIGGLDLYYSIRDKEGLWSAAINFGPNINSLYDDTMPFMAPDGRTLYFSSNRLESIGGFDIFKVTYEDLKRSWTPVINMGFPINSGMDDAYFQLTSDGTKAYFSSNRLGGKGGDDLYVAYFKEEQATAIVVSKPLFFAAVETMPLLLIGSETGKQANVTLDLIHYTNDEDLSAPKNLKNYREIAELALAYPTSKVLVTVHTEESGPAKFDLYYGIKRAEKIGEVLVASGLSSRQVLLRSTGSNFPLAREVIDMTPNPAAKNINKRVDLALRSVQKLPVDARSKKEAIPENMLSAKDAYLDEQTEGVYYKALVADTRQLLNSDVLAMFEDIMIESVPNSGDYRYTAGLYKTYAEAKIAAEDLQEQGFGAAEVLAYLNDVPLSKADAKPLVKAFPSLAPFVK